MSIATTPMTVITLAGDAGPTNDRSQTVSGTAFGGPTDATPLAGSLVTVTAGQQIVGNATVGTSGAWSADVVLPDLGENQLVASVSDANGKTVASPALVFDLETVVMPQSATATLDPTGATALTPRPDIVLYGAHLSAGSGSETFIFQAHPGHVVLAVAADGGKFDNVLSFSTASFSSLVDILHHTTMSAVGATIHLSPSDTVTLSGVTRADLRIHRDILALHP